MPLETYTYKEAGILVRITKTRKRLMRQRRYRLLSGDNGPNVYLIQVGDKHDSAFTLGKARKRAAILAKAQWEAKEKLEKQWKRSDDLLSKTGCPF